MDPTLISGDMRYWLLKPDPRLRPWIHSYFIVEPVAPAACVAELHGEDQLLIPDGHSEIVFNFGGAYERWHVGEREGEGAALMRSSYLIGGRSRSVLTRNASPVRLAGVKLDPRALHALIAVPLGAFADATLSLADLNAPGLLQLEDALASARGAAAVHGTLDRFFLRALDPLQAERAATDQLLHDLRRTRGALPILQWAREHRLDARTLERRFSAAVGMTPKRYARVIRFKHSYHQLLSAPDSRPTGAHLEGYYDQSHFNREFRYFTGTSPNARVTGAMASGTTISDHLLDGELSA